MWFYRKYIDIYARPNLKRTSQTIFFKKLPIRLYARFPAASLTMIYLDSFKIVKRSCTNNHRTTANF